MKWNKDAEKAVSRVPFFVRKRVRKRVEEEASRSGARVVTVDHVEACRKRFLERMEDEVKGFQVETCFGQGECPNRAVSSEGMADRLEGMLKGRRLNDFLKERVEGPLKMHHEFRISVSDCPNACSRPQIVDAGLIGACRPEISKEPCSLCNACVETCREEAISISDEGPVLDRERCLLCGQCMEACPTGTLRRGKEGYRIQVGGKLGRHPRLAHELPGIHDPDEALKTLERFLDFYQGNCLKGERLGEILEREGFDINHI
jgi:anaerobic sulfite reductase subunit C